ncbi:MAG: hypothetical protein ACOC4C_00980 [Fibrobacterota bacterium]
MSIFFQHLLIFCSTAGVISELISIGWPEKIVGILQRDPEELIGDVFYRSVFILSSFYLLAIILLFFSEYRFFNTYAIILLLNSLFIWLFRRIVFRFRIIQIAESTLCLILLFDVIRTVIKSVWLG